jgi:type IV pilus biogenesis protein PilP
MAALRPVPRPASAQDSGTGAETPPTKFAVVRSLTPASRPSDITGIVERAVAEAQRSEPAESVDNTVLAAASVAAPKLPPVPTRTNVATEATVKNAIDLGKINLIGVYGSSANRRALIRLSSGRYVKVQVGDKIDGGQVAAISASEVLYVKSGRKVTLEMPKS